MKTCLQSELGRCLSCPYCDWVASGASLRDVERACTVRVEAARLIRIYDKRAEKKVATDAPRLVPAGAFFKRRKVECGAARAADVGPAAKLYRFLRLLRHMDRAPWANINFSVNTDIISRLVASHLHLIVGKEAFKTCNRRELYSSISANVVLSDAAQNLVWITNRQNGKTSTLSKFIAALAVASPVGGALATIYSTSLDRSVELKKGALQYIQWLSADGKCQEFWPIKVLHNNYTTFGVTLGATGAPVNLVVARPKNPDSCRGDAPESCFFDEIGFMQESMWWQFAYPLLQVGNRVFTCTTTPAPEGTFFDDFTKAVKKRNSEGDRFFLLINHSLSCQACIEALEPERCCHNLWLIPPWKSTLKFNKMKALVPQRQLSTFATEVYGVLQDQTATYFPDKLLDPVRKLPPLFRKPKLDYGAPVWVSVDPASHDCSYMGLAAFVVSCSGEHLVLGLSSVSVQSAEITQVQMVLTQFLKKIRMHQWLKAGEHPLCPIIEMNGNEIAGRSLLSCFDAFEPLLMPWTRENFQTCITPGVGVWKTHTTTLAMVQQFYQILLDRKLRFVGSLTTSGRDSFDPKSRPLLGEAQKTELFDELSQIKDDKKGKPTGKHGLTGKDDLAVALMQGVLWSYSVRSRNLLSK